MFVILSTVGGIIISLIGTYPVLKNLFSTNKLTFLPTNLSYIYNDTALNSHHVLNAKHKDLDIKGLIILLRGVIINTAKEIHVDDIEKPITIGFELKKKFEVIFIGKKIIRTSNNLSISTIDREFNNPDFYSVSFGPQKLFKKNESFEFELLVNIKVKNNPKKEPKKEIEKLIITNSIKPVCRIKDINDALIIKNSDFMQYLTDGGIKRDMVIYSTEILILFVLCFYTSKCNFNSYYSDFGGLKFNWLQACLLISLMYIGYFPIRKLSMQCSILLDINKYKKYLH